MRTTPGKLPVCLCLMSGLLMACNAAGTARSGTDPATQAKLSPELAATTLELEWDHTLRPGARTDGQGRLQVYVYVTNTSSGTLAQLTQAGLVGASSSAEMDIVQGWIAMGDLTTLAGLHCVKIVTLPRYGSPR